MQTSSAQIETTDQIQRACKAHRVASLAVPQDGTWRMCEGRMLSFDPIESTIRMHWPKSVWGTRRPELTVGDQLGVRFSSEDRRIMFMSVVTGVCNIYEGDSRHKAVELSIVSNVVTVNQRQFYRVDVPESQELDVHLWDAAMKPITDDEEMPPVYRAKVRDLAVGGAAVYDLDAETNWELGDHLGVKLDIAGADAPLLLIAEVRRVFIRPDTNTSYGLAFISAETVRKTFYAQEVLSRLVNDYQRMHLKRRVKDA